MPGLARGWRPRPGRRPGRRGGDGRRQPRSTRPPYPGAGGGVRGGLPDLPGHQGGGAPLGPQERRAGQTLLVAQRLAASAPVDRERRPRPGPAPPGGRGQAAHLRRLLLRHLPGRHLRQPVPQADPGPGAGCGGRPDQVPGGRQCAPALPADRQRAQRHQGAARVLPPVRGGWAGTVPVRGRREAGGQVRRAGRAAASRPVRGAAPGGSLHRRVRRVGDHHLPAALLAHLDRPGCAPAGPVRGHRAGGGRPDPGAGADRGRARAGADGRVPGRRHLRRHRHPGRSEGVAVDRPPGRPAVAVLRVAADLPLPAAVRELAHA
jgi:hypothetical protein